jgi:CTP-dependent riboflavin kinase
MLHPYARKNQGDISKMIEVDIEGEIKNGLPHGQCFLCFIYRGELKYDFETSSIGN